MYYSLKGSTNSEEILDCKLSIRCSLPNHDRKKNLTSLRFINHVKVFECQKVNFIHNSLTSIK